MSEIGLVHLDDPQPLRAKAIQQTLDSRRFSCAARTEKEDVIGWVSADELLDVCCQARHRRLDADQIVQLEAMWLLDRNDSSGPAADVPAKGEVSVEQLGLGRQPGEIFQHPLRKFQDSTRAREEALFGYSWADCRLKTSPLLLNVSR